MKIFYTRIFYLISIFWLCIASASADEYKIGVVNQQTAIENSLCGKHYQQYMQKELNMRQEQLSAKKNLYVKKSEDLQRDKDILSKKELDNKQKELALLQQDLQKMHEKFELEIGNKDQEEHQKINKLFNKAISNLGKSNKYDIIIPVNIVFYSGDKVTDITSKVTTELDKVYKEQKK